MGQPLTLQGAGWNWGDLPPDSHVPLLHPAAAKALQRFEPGGDGSSGRNAPRQRFLLLEVMDKKVDVGPGAEWEKGLCDLTDPDPDS